MGVSLRIQQAWWDVSPHFLFANAFCYSSIWLHHLQNTYDAAIGTLEHVGKVVDSLYAKVRAIYFFLVMIFNFLSVLPEYHYQISVWLSDGFSRGNDAISWRYPMVKLESADETTYTLDTYPGHSLDTCDIPIDFPMHFHSIFDYFDILWFISTSRRTSNITCWSHSHCDLLPIASQHASPLFHPSYLQPIISLKIEVFSLISHGHWSIIVMHY